MNAPETGSCLSGGLPRRQRSTSEGRWKRQSLQKSMDVPFVWDFREVLVGASEPER